MKYAKHIASHARALSCSAKSFVCIPEAITNKKAAIHSLARLAGGARNILDQHEDEMSRFFSQMRVILGILQNQESDLTGLLKYAPFHDRNTQLVEYQQFNQVLQDFIVCGMNDDPKDPAPLDDRAAARRRQRHAA